MIFKIGNSTVIQLCLDKRQSVSNGSKHQASKPYWRSAMSADGKASQEISKLVSAPVGKQQTSLKQVNPSTSRLQDTIGSQVNAAIPAQGEPDNPREAKLRGKERLGKERRQCECCEKMFTPDPFNYFRQRFCTENKKCAKEGKRQYQNEWCHTRRLTDEDWRIDTDKRTAGYHRNRQERDKAAEEARIKDELERIRNEERFEAMLLGLIVNATKSKSQEEIKELAATIEKDGHEILLASKASGLSILEFISGRGVITLPPSSKKIQPTIKDLQTK